VDEDIGAGDGARVLIGKGIGSGIGDVVEEDGEETELGGCARAEYLREGDGI
jgi:hypothetical protein